MSFSSYDSVYEPWNYERQIRPRRDDLDPETLLLRRRQRGGQVTPMNQFWQRQLSVDQLTTAPHVDCMIKLLNDMKQVERQALPLTQPGQGPNSSDYFRLQGQPKNMPAQSVKRLLLAKPSAAAPKPSGRPSPPRRSRKPSNNESTLRRDSINSRTKLSKTWRKRSNGVTTTPSKKRISIGGS